MADPASEMVARLVGESVNSVAIEQRSIRFSLDTSFVTVEGHWRLTGPDDEVVERGSEEDGSRARRLNHQIGTTVVASRLTPDGGLLLSFGNRFRFEATADDDGLEDWQLTFRDGSLLIANGNHLTTFGAAESPHVEPQSLEMRTPMSDQQPAASE